MMYNPFHVIVSYNAPFLLTLNSQLSNCCQQLYAKMTANSNLALILRHPLYRRLNTVICARSRKRESVWGNVRKTWKERMREREFFSTFRGNVRLVEDRG